MPAPEPLDLLLFVAGEPGSGETPAWRYVRFLGPALGGLSARAYNDPDGAPRPGPSGAPERHLPPEAVRDVQVLLDEASASHRRVKMVDVNRPGEDRYLVERWVHADDVMPVLVRPDGARLRGAENFTPRKIRQFLGTSP
jgi:hypothetical protein